MSWDDWMSASGAATGIVNGLTAGAKPFTAWEDVRTKDLANDKSELTLRDLYQMQDALENPDLNYYGNAASAKDSGNRKTYAANETDIFGNEQKLALGRYLTDPEGEFQQGLKETGWVPGSPEYNQWLSEAIAGFDPMAGQAANDKFKIPEMQNRNLNEQAALQYIENYAKQKDPDARVERKPDGTVVIVSNGEETPVPGDTLMHVAAMISAKTPEDAVSKGLKDEIAIQKVNAEIIKALQTGQITPASAAKMIQEQGVRLNQSYQGAMRELAAITKSQDYMLATPEDKQAMTQELVKRISATKTQMDQNQQMLNKVVTQSALPRMTGGAPGPRGPRAQGDTTVTTRPPPGAFAARAAGIPPGGASGWGRSSEGPAYPTPRVSPQDTGIRPISGMDDGLDEFLQLIGGMA